MKVLYNSRILSDSSVSLELNDRAFCYGDGIFETIVTGDNRINLVELHFERLQRGCTILSLRVPFKNASELYEKIQALSRENSMSGSTRSRLQVWRKSGGRYTPESNESNSLLTLEKINGEFYSSLNSLGDCKNTKINYSNISFTKTLNALPYVLAGLEKKKSEFNDLIITNNDSYIAEATSSNIFWIKDAKFYTPSLKTGCVDGVMRKHIINLLKKNNTAIEELLVHPDELLNAQSIFITNVTGIRWIKKYRNNEYLDPKNSLKDIINLS